MVVNGLIYIYKPISIHKIIPDCDPFDEDKYTLKYIEQNGIENVRGGSFCTVELTDQQIDLINTMIKSASDKSGNFINSSIQSKIDEDLKDINDENVSSKASEIKSIYEEIHKLNKLIELTDFIKIDNLPEIKKESEDNNKINKLRDEQVKLGKYIDNKSRDYHDKIRKIDQEIRTLSAKHKYWRKIITEKYYNYDLFKQDISMTAFQGLRDKDIDIVILGLELIKFNLQKKKSLKQIYNKYHSEEYVKELLSRLYQMEIEIITSQI